MWKCLRAVCVFAKTIQVVSQTSTPSSKSRSNLELLELFTLLNCCKKRLIY